jgi:hypothetical protein
MGTTATVVFPVERTMRRPETPVDETGNVTSLRSAAAKRD